jgi:hypothetical protein
MPRPITLRSSLSDMSMPPLLLKGEFAVTVGPTYTKLWVGQGAANRLLLSTDPADTPLVSSAQRLVALIVNDPVALATLAAALGV